MKAMLRKNYEKPKIYKRAAVMHVCLCQSISGITHSSKGAITLVNAIAKIHTKWSNSWREQVTIPFAFFITKKTQNFGFFKRRLEPFSSVRRSYSISYYVLQRPLYLDDGASVPNWSSGWKWIVQKWCQQHLAGLNCVVYVGTILGYSACCKNSKNRAEYIFHKIHHFCKKYIL